MKKIVSLVFSLLLIASLASTALAAESASLSNFKQVNAYESGQFGDVKSSDWFESSVKAAYELGLVKGSSDTTFTPAGSVTIAESLALASRLYSIYHTGSAEFTQGEPWYQVYVDYAIANDIIADGQFADYSSAATRAQFAQILANALDSNALVAINNIEVIPDVPDSANYASAIKLLYNAGVLTGNDKYGTFTPDSNVQRSAVAAIVSRMADVSQRKVITLEKAPIMPTNISLNSSSIELLKGDSAILTVSVFPSDAVIPVLTWTSSNVDVVTVENGTVTATGDGIATISVITDNELTASCTISVIDLELYVLNDLSTLTRKYSNAEPLGATVLMYTNTCGETCVATNIGFKIINDYNYYTIWNLKTGKRIHDADVYFENQRNLVKRTSTDFNERSTAEHLYVESLEIQIPLLSVLSDALEDIYRYDPDYAMYTYNQKRMFAGQVSYTVQYISRNVLRQYVW